MSVDLSTLAARLRGLKDAGTAIASEAAPGILEEAKRTAAAGTTPTGDAWAPRKADGARAMPNAASGLSVRAEGDVVVLTLGAPYVFNQKKRPIIPYAGSSSKYSGIPEGMKRAIGDAAGRVIGRVLA